MVRFVQRMSKAWATQFNLKLMRLGRLAPETLCPLPTILHQRLGRIGGYALA